MEPAARCLFAFTMSAGGVLLCLAFGLQLEEPTHSEDRARSDPPRFWAHRMRKLQVVLYAGAALLTAMILEQSSIIRWAFPPSGPIPLNHTSAHALVLVRGIIATFLLVGIYVPAHLNIARQMARAVESTRGARQRYRSTMSLPKQLIRLVSLFAPLLTGQLGEVISKFQEAMH